MCLSIFCKWGEGVELLPVVNKCAKSFSSLYTWEWNCYITGYANVQRKPNCFLKVLWQVTVLPAMFKSASCFLAFLTLSIISGGETVSYCSLNLYFLTISEIENCFFFIGHKHIGLVFCQMSVNIFFIPFFHLIYLSHHFISMLFILILIS